MLRLSLVLIMAATMAHAHVGHLGELAGHDHWIAAGAIGLAGLVAVWGAFKGKKIDTEKSQDTDEKAEA